MNKSILIVALLVVVVGGWWLVKGTPSATDESTGRIVVSVTDAAADMGNVASLDMTISGVEMHSVTQGWVSVDSDSATVDLLELKASGEFVLVASADVAVDTYDQVRVMIDDVTVTTKDGASAEAKVPSGEIKFMGSVVVAEGETSTLSLDFLADASLHSTGDGDFIFAPVIVAESRSGAEVEVDSNNRVKINGGSVTTSVNVGMDTSGETRANFRLDTSGGVEIEGDVIKLKNNAEVKSGAGVDVSL